MSESAAAPRRRGNVRQRGNSLQVRVFAGVDKAERTFDADPRYRAVAGDAKDQALVRDLNRLETATMRVTSVSTVKQTYDLIPNALAGDELALTMRCDAFTGIENSDPRCHSNTCFLL